MIKRITLLLTFMFVSLHALFSQELHNKPSTALLPGSEAIPRLALKTNLLYGLTTTFNLGAELRLSDYLTLDVSANYNPWTFSGNSKIKHILVQPELRYWIHEPFNGHFLGAHLSYINYNASNVKLPLDIFPGLDEYRYRGYGYGMGFSYGYQWLLSPRWGIEASFGFGYMYTDYSRYECKTCGSKIDDRTNHYFGPTKASVSLIYVIK